MSRNEREIQERRFAHEVCASLDAAAHDLPPDVSARLAAARRIALAHKKAEATVRQPVYAAAGPHAPPVFEEDETPLHRAGAWLGRFGLVLTVVALAAGLFGIYQWQQQKRIEEMADVDAAMLLDDLPPAAYADQGFHVFLKRGE